MLLQNKNMNPDIMPFNIEKLSLAITAIMLCLLLTACEVVPPKNGATIDRIGAALTEGTDHEVEDGQPPPEVSAALLPSLNIDVPEPSGNSESSEPRFDVAAKDVDAQDFFMSLVEGTSINLVVDPEVTGKITLNLKNVTIEETMDVIRDIYGYEYQKTKLGYMVYARKLQSRIFHVNYLNIKRSGISEMRVTSGQLPQSGNDSNSDSSTTSSDSSSGTSTSNTTTGSVINTTSETDFWTDLAAALKIIVGEGDGKSVVVNPPSGLVVVKAMSGDLRNIEEFIKQIHKVTERQVILEAKILEVELNDGFQSGINWAALGDPEDGGSVLAGQVGGGSLLSGTAASGGLSSIQGQSGNLDPRNFSEVAGAGVEAFGGMFTLALNLNEFNAFIELLGTQGNVQVLSSPRVSTVNNQKAVIKVGSDEYFVTNVETNITTSAATESVNPSVQLTPFFSGIALDVTPQITEDGAITLHIHPSVSTVEDQTKTFSVGGDNNIVLPLAFISTRESDSIVRAQNRQIVVIGGLMKDEMREVTSSVPILGDIPFLGALFRHNKQISQKSELVILLRPVVIENDHQWTQIREESAARFNNLNRGFHYGGKIEVFGSMGEERSN